MLELYRLLALLFVLGTVSLLMIPSYNNAVAQISSCNAVILNFDDLAHGARLGNLDGTDPGTIHAQLAPFGIKVSAQAKDPDLAKGEGIDTLIIYDSRFVNGKDPDLEHPFNPNADPLVEGIPIIPTNDDPQGSLEPVAMPNDWRNGGTVVYTFDHERILRKFTGVDDLNRLQSMAVVFDNIQGTGTPLATIPIDMNNVDRGTHVYDIDDISGVKRIDFFYPSSGGITNIELGCVPTPVCGNSPPPDTSGLSKGQVLGTTCVPGGGTIKIVKDFLPSENPQVFNFRFTPNGMNPQTFQLDDDSSTTLPNSKVFNVRPGFFEITESPSVVIPPDDNDDENDNENDNEIKLIGLNDIDCIGDVKSKITKDGNKVKIEFIGSDNIVCTFFNSACTQGIALLRFEYLGTPQPVDITYLQKSNLQDTFFGVGIGDLNDVVPLGNDVKLSSTTDFEIRDPTGKLLDTITKHTSCSQPIFVGETVQGINGIAELKIAVLNFVGVPTIPGTADDTATTQQNTPVTIDVLSNDFSVLYITSVETTTLNGGSAVINQDNTVTYTPAPNFVGTDSFVYQVRYSEGEYDSAAVTVTITSGDKHEGDTEDNEEKYDEKEDKETQDMLAKLQQKVVKLDKRIQSLLEKYEKGKYYGPIPEGDQVTKSYSLSLDGSASSIRDSTEADFSGEILIERLGAGTDSSKFRVTGGQLIIGDISYDVIFGKARTIFSSSGDKDSMVILAQLLDEEGNVNTLRISFVSKVSLQDEPSEPINFEISQRSKIAHNWHLSASGQLSILEP